jgi:hypothetical protein
MSRDHQQFKLRMPPALRALVEQSAEAARRSLNAELIVRLEQSFALEVAANESQQVSAATPRLGLRLLCVLVKARSGQTRSLPVHTLRPMPPRISAQGKWSLADHPGFYLRETHAKPAPASVLARNLHHGQANSFRPDLRTIPARGLSQ